MNLADSHFEPLAVEGRRFAALHELFGRRPRMVASLKNIGRIDEWLVQLRAAAKEPEFSSVKAAEWLLDNDFQIQRAASQAAKDLPPEFYSRLPSLAEDGIKGQPRILANAYEFLLASHLQLSLTAAIQFTQGYQEIAPLTIGELWAFPTTLRLVCLEILADACSRLFPEVPAPFSLSKELESLEGFDDTERVARAISGLIAITSIRWKDFFDRTSLVEKILRTDPADVYARMDFETRDRYRKVIEELALETAQVEVVIATEAVARAGIATSAPENHVGYLLIGAGRQGFEASIGCRISWKKSFARSLMARPGLLYTGMLALASGIALVPPAIYLVIVDAGIGGWVLGITLASVPATVIAVTSVHWIITLATSPRVLPKLDFENGLPPDCASVVAVPVILHSAEEVPQLMRHIESHRLANPGPSLRYVLLSDLQDAPREHLPADKEIEAALRGGIRELNARHGIGDNNPFFLLHRPRQYNSCECCWMGRERKRGKLEEFNNLVLNGDRSSFSLIEGDPDALKPTRFVVTVDADTILPPGAVKRLVGTLAHPLNSARFEPNSRRILGGYTIVQPRVEISPQSGGRSLFAKLFAGNTAIDIYTRAVSDVYQDLFGEGIYVGKGVYEVATFSSSLFGRVPENALVSHDLFEGVHGRAALASDIVLYENFPASYVEYARRWHRWVRGDWQLLPWLFAKVSGCEQRRLSNELSKLDRWKILDNLRRSLIPFSLLLLLIAGWLLIPGDPWIWTALAVAAPGAYLFTDIVTGLARGPRRGAMQGILHQIADHWGRWGLAIVFLVHDSLVAVDAIIRTLWRLFVTRKHLLEWTSAAHTAATLNEGDQRIGTWQQMWSSPVLAVGLGIVVVIFAPSALPAALPLLILWFVSPEIAIFISRPKEPPLERVDPKDENFLRLLARRTWLFFEVFVGPGDNWLPPDNFQEEPSPVVAHRTSPTNIGMMYLSTLAAWDLGFVDTREFAVRIANTFSALDRLERYWGHLLNWYETTTLEPLEPRYVSTVDSGNLAVCLIALKQGCNDAARAPVMRPQLWDGLTDTLRLLVFSANELPAEAACRIEKVVSRIEDRILIARANPGATWSALADLTDNLFPELHSAVIEKITSAQHHSNEALADIQIWMERAQHHLTRMREDYSALAPWLQLLDNPPSGQEELAARLSDLLSANMTLIEAPGRCTSAREVISAERSDKKSPAAQWLADLEMALEEGGNNQKLLRDELLSLGRTAEQMAFAMDFRPLFDSESRLFHIGYNISSDRSDPSHYDLLASEARLASFFAIAKGDVGFEHWFILGRSITRVAGGLTLVSWNGSMFEYLMPALLLRSAPETLLGESERTAVDAQRTYCDRNGVPWGISESAFAEQDAAHNYRYRSFGVSELGLRRDLNDDLVISPYATALALPVRTEMSIRNLRSLADLGLVGTYGFYDAVDFTPERVPPRKRFTVVRNFMAHHQGMTLAALDNALCSGILANRFASHPSIHAMELLVQERIPWELPSDVKVADEPDAKFRSDHALPSPNPWTPRANAPYPQLHTLGNGRLSSWISEAGAGTLRWREFALTRWLPDATCDDWGMWNYLRDEEDGTLWSVGRQPIANTAEDTRVIFHPHMAEFHRRNFDISARMEVAVSQHDDVEIRRISLVNEGDRTRRLRLTSFGEVVLAAPADDERHFAFSKLFVGSEYLPEHNALLFSRRPRQPEEKPPFLLHRMVADDAGVTMVGYETDRARFLGRLGDIRRPLSLRAGLSETTGWTLDTIMALDVKVELAPNERKQLAFVTMAAQNREALLSLAEHYATPAPLDWALDEAAVEAAREANQLGLNPVVLPLLQQLASLLAYRHSALRAPAEQIVANRLGQQRLWVFGVSGDNPILLVRASDPENVDLLKTLIAGHQLWRRRGLKIDLVVIRPGMSGYVEPLRDQIISQLHGFGAQETLGRHGGVHLVLGDQIGEEGWRCLEASADAILDTSYGSLVAQLEATFTTRPESPVFEPGASDRPEEATPGDIDSSNLQLDNGIGGFAKEGAEYVINLEPGVTTPAPWCNVLANDGFGTIVTEAGGGFTWAVNSGENRLTPWTNDPVSDSLGEALYIREEATGDVWTPMPQPAGAGSPCQVRHGAGYSVWRRFSHRFDQKLTIFVPTDDPVKIVRLEVKNLSSETRRITATYYAEWLLGALRSISRSHVVTGYLPSCHALTARNPWNVDFADRVAFLTSDRPPHSLTCDRQDFLGRHGNLSMPDGLTRWDLGGRIGPRSDSCAAFQVHLEIGPNSTMNIDFILGQGRNEADAIELATKWQQPECVSRALDELQQHWDRHLRAVEVRTPDPAFDTMLNRWLPYQTLSSRIMARAGFYQAGGAFGFRDQLQDVLALMFSDPERTRAHILEAAAHQFEEGDVLHWWHPPKNRGVRTRCSDDLIWLPYATTCYVEATADFSILEEPVPFLSATPLKPNEYDRYACYDSHSEPYSLLEHCERALEAGVTSGPHGMPLMGSGDWNDGMDRVGRQGRGESVWLGWFVIDTMRRFAKLCRRIGKGEAAKRWEARARQIEKAIESAAWDGEWYLRAIDDDGVALGSASAKECRIDSIAQSWSVLAEGANAERTIKAVGHALSMLVSDDDRLARLLWPPFDKSLLDPGYIKAYPAGIRENGGQYSHAAAWLGHALARLEDGDGAMRIFNCLNPAMHGSTASDLITYRVEPYALAADIAGAEPHTGRGGWTWYTGAAGWTWRLGIEAILGLRLCEGRLIVDPCLPKDWGSFRATVRGKTGELEIHVENPEGICKGRVEILVAGKWQKNAPIDFPGDGSKRRVDARIVA